MQAPDVKGIIAAMVTPFNEDESLNEAELRNHVDRMIEAGVDGVFTGGTNGEFYAMTPEERTRAMEIVVEQTAHRVPVYAGAGAVTTKETIQLVKNAKAAGADAVSVIAPYFAQASQADLQRHYEAVSDNSELPIVLYNIPARTSNSLAPATVEKLAKRENIVAIKDSSGNFDNMLQYLERTDRETFSVLSGTDSLILWILQAGGTGGITAVSNVYPKTMVAIYQRWLAGDLEGAKQAQSSIRPYRNCFTLGNPNTITKRAVNELGFPVGPCRAPFGDISDDAVKLLRSTLEEGKANGMA